MSYLTDFNDHWSHLEGAMKFNMGRLRDKGAALTTEAVNSLFQTEAMKWSSMVEIPGMWLDDLKDAPLAEEIRAELNAFRFQPANRTDKPNTALVRLLGSAAAGIFCGVLLPMKLLPSVLIGFALFLAVFLLTGKISDRKDTDRFESDRSCFMNQLAEERGRLEKICRKYD